MEHFFEKDSSFELQSDLDGMELLNNRILTTMPSEKSSFQIDLGFDGYSNKNTVDPEKIAQGITAGASALGSVVGTVQAFKGDGTKAPSRKKALKEVCGKKPLTKKKQESTGYTKCVADYNAGNTGGSNNNKSTDTSTQTDETPPPKDNKKMIIIGVVVVAVLVTAFIGYKKGWFGVKAK